MGKKKKSTEQNEQAHLKSETQVVPQTETEHLENTDKVAGAVPHDPNRGTSSEPKSQSESHENEMKQQEFHMQNEATTEENYMNQEESELNQKFKIEFPYSDLVRAKAPKAFEVAETVADQWIKNEKFENLGLPHPLAEVAAVKILEKAKKVETKLEEKGVITAAKMGAQIAKMQAEAFLSKIKKKS